MAIDIDYAGQMAKGALEQMNKTRDQAIAQGGLDVQNRYADINQQTFDANKIEKEKERFQTQFTSALQQTTALLNSTQDPAKREALLQMMGQMKELFTGPVAQQYGLADYNAKMIDFAMQSPAPLETAKLQGQMSLESDPLSVRKLDILEKTQAQKSADASGQSTPQDASGFKAPELSATEVAKYRERLTSVGTMLKQFDSLEPILEDPNAFVGAGGTAARLAGSVAGEIQQGLKAAGMKGSDQLETASKKAEEQAVPAQKIRSILGEMVATTVKAQSGANASNQDRKRAEERFGYNSGNKDLMLVATLTQMQSAFDGAISDHESKFPGQPLPLSLQQDLARFEAIKEKYRAEIENAQAGAAQEAAEPQPTAATPVKRIRFDRQGNPIQ